MPHRPGMSVGVRDSADCPPDAPSQIAPVRVESNGTFLRRISIPRCVCPLAQLKQLLLDIDYGSHLLSFANVSYYARSSA